MTLTERLLFEFTIPRIKFSNEFWAEFGHDISGQNGITTTAPSGAGVRQMGDNTDSGDEISSAVRTNSGVVNEVVNDTAFRVFDAHVSFRCCACVVYVTLMCRFGVVSVVRMCRARVVPALCLRCPCAVSVMCL